MSILDARLLDALTKPGFRLPMLSEWLQREVWTMERYQEVGKNPKEYLLQGECLVHEREKLLTMAGESIYEELAAEPPEDRSIKRFLDQNPGGAIVILDGCSIRELPRLVELANSAARPVVEQGVGRAAVPSETEMFITNRMALGLPRISPNQLPGRRELQELGIRAYWFRHPTENIRIKDTPGSPLLWMRFPDMRFMDTHAASPELFDAIWDMLETVWKVTVQALPSNRPILVTSDHGYIFLSPNLSDPRLNKKQLDKLLNGKRYREFEPHEPLPVRTNGLWVDSGRGLAVLTGRIHNRPQAPSPSQSLYRHGGLSLMEMLTPWLILGPKEEHHEVKSRNPD
ncbi:MAG: hypothetical protein R3B74_18005 [Nitrospirales bacterium]|nr:hypothetical protein [Nitrospirales bacterium]